MLVRRRLRETMYSKNNSSQEKPKFYSGHRNRKSHDELKINNEDFNQKLNDQNQINILDIGFGSGESIVTQDFKQNNTRIAVFGKNTVKAAQDSGLRIDIEAPLPKIPSMSRALDVYIEKANKAKA